MAAHKPVVTTISSTVKLLSAAIQGHSRLKMKIASQQYASQNQKLQLVVSLEAGGYVGMLHAVLSIEVVELIVLA